MTAPDFREWLDARDEGSRAERKAFRADTMHAIRRLAAQGARYFRATWVRAYGLKWFCLEGWRERPSDRAPPPTVADVPVGFE